jgi:nitrogen fixation protein NifB
MKDISKHPCFNEEARRTYARVHLPVAPKCNVQSRTVGKHNLHS